MLPCGMLTSFIIQSDHLAATTNVSLGILLSSPVAQVFFMPQKPYMFLGTLKDQLLYPNVKEWTSKFTCLGLEYERTQLSIHAASFN